MKKAVWCIPFLVLVCCLISACTMPPEEWPDAIAQRQKEQENFREQAEALVARMTLEEKIGLFLMDSAAVERLGIGPHNWWNEALHGVARNGPATQFPQAISIASTWDPQLIQEMSAAIGKEARARHHQAPGRTGRYQGLTIWSPTINLARDPRWGRNEETYGEDPLLTSEMAVAFVKGLQGTHPKYLQAVATVKHFIANNTEHNRYTYRPAISERDLREHYMPAYKAAVQDAAVQSIMTAYNGVNDVPCSASRWLLTDLLREEWGFRGTVVTDVGAPERLVSTHEYADNHAEGLAFMLKAGVDVSSDWVPKLSDAEQALAEEMISMEDLDRAIIQNLTTRMQLGQIVKDRDNPYAKIPKSVVGSAKHLQIAREIAQKGAVLLKNEPVNGRPILPLQQGRIKQIIVAGPYANAAFLGHYSGTPTHRAITPFGGLRSASGGIKVTMHQFAGDNPQALPASVLRPPAGEDAATGLKGEYFRSNCLEGEPEATRIDRNIDFTWQKPIGNVDPLIPGDRFSVRWTGRLVPDISGEYRLAVKEATSMRVWLADTMIIDTSTTNEPVRIESEPLQLEEGESYDLKVEYIASSKHTKNAYLGWKLPRDYDADFFAPGLAPDSATTLVIYVGGFNPAMSGEWLDKEDLALPADQRSDLQRWAKRYQNIAVVLSGGTIVTEPWLFEQFPALMHTWYAGQQGGHALADLILGRVSPSGRLPLTWYRSVTDLPPLDDYAIHFGRTYMYNEKPVQFPFGHGLSYTTFEYGPVNLSAKEIGAADTLMVEVPVRNTGKCAAEEVVQVYVHDPVSTVYQPKQKLVAFGRISVEPGQESVLRLEIPAERFAYWNAQQQCFTVEPGLFELRVGGSSADIRQTVGVTVK